MTNLQDLLNPDFLQRVIGQQQSQGFQASPQTPYQAQAPQNPYGVPVVYTEPDVVLRGRLELGFTFRHDDISGKSAEEVKQLAYAVVMGQRGPGFPEVTVGHLNIWQEVQKNAPAQGQEIDDISRRRIIGEFLAELGQQGLGPEDIRSAAAFRAGIPGTGPTSDGGSPWYSGPGNEHDDAEPGSPSLDYAELPDSLHGAVDASGNGSNPGPAARTDPAARRANRRQRKATEEPVLPPGEDELIQS